MTTMDDPLKRLNAGARRVFGLAALFSLAVNLLMLTIPLYMLSVFDRVIISRNIDTLIYLTLIAVFALVVMGALDLVRSKLLMRFGLWADHTLSPIVFGSILEMRKGGHDLNPRLLHHVREFRSYLGSGSILQLFDAPWLPVYLLILFMLHPIIGTIGLIGSAILLGLAYLNERVTRRAFEKGAELQARAQQQADATIGNRGIIRALGMKSNIVGHWMGKYLDAIHTNELGNERSRLILAFAKTFRFILQIVVLGAGAYLVVQREFTPGTMIAGSILLARALAPVENAIDTWRNAVGARDAYNYLKAFFTMIAEDDTGERLDLPAPRGNLRLEGVYYAYPQSNHAIIRGINLEIHPGEVVALIGPSRAGKSTLAQLLIGVIEPRAGTVRLDEIELKNWPRESLGPHLGYLPQDVELFAGTVAENISRFSKLDSDAVIAAAKLAGVHELVSGMPDAYETQISHRGTNLSGGERQRIGLACALYGFPSIVVLDEPNANLDAAGEQRLLQVVAYLKSEGVTVIFIAHRPSLLQSADRVIFMRDGHIEEDGPRDEILARVMRPRVPPPQTPPSVPPPESPSGPGSSSAPPPAPPTSPQQGSDQEPEKGADQGQDPGQAPKPE